MTESFRDASLEQYDLWIEYELGILADAKSGTLPYNTRTLATFIKNHEYALDQLRAIRARYAEELPND